MKWVRNSWFSCSKYAERMSRALDAPLSSSEKVGYTFHHYFCLECRRFSTQIIQLEQTLEEFVNSHEIASVGLSDEAKSRIEKHIKNSIDKAGN